MAHGNIWGINASGFSPKSLFYFVVSLLLFSIQLHATSINEGKQAFLDRDYAKALSILEPLAVQGNPEAQVTLGLMHELGHGVEKNIDTAIDWYKAAADQGLANVQHDLGVKYFNGDGVEKDFAEAIKWWEKAEKAGYADSQFNLGLMYYRGIGTTINYKKAQALFEKAAAQNHGNAQYSLGVMYAFGQGVSQSYQQALELFFKAAAQNVAQAQFNLGVFYENGYGVAADAKEANKWYTLAAEQGLSEAANKVGNVSTPEKQKVNEPVETKTKETIPEETPAPQIVADETPVIAEPAQTQQSTASIDTGIATELPTEQQRTEWLRSQPSDRYTIQIASFLQENEAIDYINKHRLGDQAGYVNVFVKNENRITLIYGYYSSYGQAKRAGADLANTYNIQPWVRNIGKLQETLR